MMPATWSRSTCATLACIWEATAPKPGNVYPGADFEDVCYADFLTSAAVIGPVIDRVEELGVGATIRTAAEATRASVGSNTNLGMLLLIGPLAAVPRTESLVSGIDNVLASLGPDDTREVYDAIRVARPGGLGKVDKADVHADNPPCIPLVEVMRLAAERDSIARQYVGGFSQVFEVANRIGEKIADGWPLGDAIVYVHLQTLSVLPDSLILRKCGERFANEAMVRASAVLESGVPGDESYERAAADFDLWLRGDGHRRNPGTTADLIAAALFVLLREDRIARPVCFFKSVPTSTEEFSS